jgi:hypothetical protein
MADFNKIVQQVGTVAERVADVSDAARGKGVKKSGGMRWLIVPAAAAGVYIAAKSSTVGRSAKAFVGQAKDRASEMPDMDLLSRVKDVAGVGEDGQQEGQAGSARRRTSDARDLEQHRRDRAEHRENRRESIST